VSVIIPTCRTRETSLFRFQNTEQILGLTSVPGRSLPADSLLVLLLGSCETPSRTAIASAPGDTAPAGSDADSEEVRPRHAEFGRSELIECKRDFEPIRSEVL